MSAPWMPLYVADYLADTGHLSTTEHGAYMLLIMHYWKTGALPATEKSIKRIARLPGLQWVNCRENIGSMFHPDWTPRFKTHFEHPNYRYVPEETRTQVMRKSCFACHYCGTRDAPLEVDHVIPIARGGSNGIDNLVAACRTCNASKGAKLVSEWAQ